MMHLEKKEAIEQHRKMWNWIADEIERRQSIIHKKEYFDANIPEEERPYCICYCCHYNILNVEALGEDCPYCPVVWGEGPGESETMCMSGEYGAWLSSMSWEESARIARIIAYLPERKGKR